MDLIYFVNMFKIKQSKTVLNSEGQTDRGIKGRLHSENVTPHHNTLNIRPSQPGSDQLGLS